ncbi:MAG: nucleoside 2-deoxyribosyltransferase [Aphanocapsa feldmannii 277cV]|uniref:Nucleoside 2-deoxyribosyltransferase n=2 Tax=Aphanocapsa feldmannii TaxID=192050 RepID=A0A524RQ96_9CHRO|nr:MAG: nucleoside 2-deoxyribosyltransferase [Aphanocapsa feldmannii 288cV]TGG94616.1 MAG: nucleoside 2-deoxyribosyltransferase [Aphanocapsa feldmannii 277cV]TGH18373.1 MAG: nucleoside 2-deoxyribosyltransferase [Aphanocapsa feldmannii 277cI]
MSDAAPLTLYLASGYGFSAQQRRLLLPELVDRLSRLGYEVWEPFSRNNQIDLSGDDWVWTVAAADRRDVEQADLILAVCNGTPPDEGVMVELGMAIALGKPTVLFRDDFRRCSDSDGLPLNLMLFAGIPADDWQAWYYDSLEGLDDPAKVLVRDQARWLVSLHGAAPAVA